MRKPTKRDPKIYRVEHTGLYGTRARVGVDAITGQDRWERPEHFQTIDEAQQWRSSVSASRKRNRTAPTRVTVAELLETDNETQLALGDTQASTADTYRRHNETHVKPTIGNLRAADLTARDLNRLYADMRTGGRRPAVSAATVQLLHAMGSGAYTRAVKRGDLTDNPFKRATPPASDTAETPTWSLAELQQFLGSELVRNDPGLPVALDVCHDRRPTR
jgi:hypothetical protein